MTFPAPAPPPPTADSDWDSPQFRAGIDQNTESLVPSLDGTRTLRQAIDDAAHARVVDSEDLEPFTTGALALVQTMLGLGFLSRAEPLALRRPQRP